MVLPLRVWTVPRKVTGLAAGAASWAIANPENQPANRDPPRIKLLNLVDCFRVCISGIVRLAIVLFACF
jgi:hypothetical protein